MISHDQQQSLTFNFYVGLFDCNSYANKLAYFQLRIKLGVSSSKLSIYMGQKNKKFA